MPETVKFNYTKWHQSHIHHCSVIDFLLSDICDGVHTIKTNCINIDVLIKNFNKENIDANKRVLIVFSGAITSRTEITEPPFFSGVGLSKSTGLPLISFSDPSLYLSTSLSLGWYAGNFFERNLPTVISSIINFIAKKFEIRPILIGGSGGGYACIQQAFLLNHDSDIIACNPQTNISKYNIESCVKYIETGFPNIIEPFKNLDNSSIKSEHISQTFDHIGLSYDLTKYSFPKKHKLFYLQNISDWHVETHAKPFFQKNISEWIKNDKTTFIGDGFAMLFFASWGNGHIPPPVELLSDLIISISENKNFNEIISLGILKSNKDFDAKIFTPEEKKIIISNIKFEIHELDSLHYIIVDFPPNSGLDTTGLRYALYCHYGENKDIFRYQESPRFKIDDPLKYSKFNLFIKDSLGDMISKSYLLKDIISI